MKLTNRKRAIAVFKKVYYTPTLPNDIIKFQNNPIIRIFRFLSGLSFISLLILNKTLIFHSIFGYGILFNLFAYICFTFILFFNVYLFYINYHRIIHIYKTINSDKLNLRN